MDFVLKVSFDNAVDLHLSRSYRSFLDAYKPQHAFMITKNQTGTQYYNGCEIQFIALEDLPILFDYC